MCVAMPGKVLSVSPEKKTAVVDFTGSRVSVRTGFVPVEPGDEVMVHAGFVLQKISCSEAEELRQLMDELAAFST